MRNQLTLGTKLQSTMNLLGPKTGLYFKRKQLKMCTQRNTYNREFEPEQKVHVMTCDYCGKDIWIPEMIVQRPGPRFLLHASGLVNTVADKIVTSQILIM